jgi:hypothetical protein
MELLYSAEKYSPIDTSIQMSAEGTTYFQMELFKLQGGILWRIFIFPG